MAEMTKEYLLEKGLLLLSRFCTANNLSFPGIKTHSFYSWPFDACAYYRKNIINICLPKCGNLGRGGPAWSWPGYVIDRTPYGVVAHELGHHTDLTKGEHKDRYFSEYSKTLREASGEPKLTGYCPNDAEWFAEMFRLFITNPDLLAKLRPTTFGLLIDKGFRPVVATSWDETLIRNDAPERTMDMCAKKVTTAAGIA